MKETKKSFTVEVQTAPLEPIERGLLEAFSAALSADRELAGPSAGLNALTRVLSVRASIDAVAPEDALKRVIGRVRLALKRSGVSNAELTEAVVQRDLEQDAFASARDDLVGTPEVAERLGISRQRVAQLVDKPGRFPHPVATVRGTHVWRWGDIVDWLAAGKRDLRRKPIEAMDDLELLALAVPSRGPSEEGRRARFELGRRGFTAWENSFQRAERLARNERPRSLRELLEKLDDEALKRFDSVGSELDPQGIAEEVLYARGYVHDSDRRWERQVDSGRGPGIAVGRVRIERTR